jgi:hypothetical protein
MIRRSSFVPTVVFVAMLSAACTTSRSPLEPEQPAGGSTANGSLKVSAPTKSSPINGATLFTRSPTLVLTAARGTFGAPSVSYEIQVTTTAGEVVYTRTVAGGPADGGSTISHAVASPLPPRGQFRWRARAVSGNDTGPWSDSAAAGAATFITNVISPASSNAEFRDYFFKVIEDRQIGPTPTQQAFLIMEPDLTAVEIIIAKDSSGFIRGRIYLPTGGADRYARSVDVITGFGGGHTWTWNERGATKCEGICP